VTAATALLDCRVAGPGAELAAHLRIRRQVFVHEQQVFTGTDADQWDDDGCTVHVLGLVDGVPAGTVRLHPLERPGLWRGDRLAVLPQFRRAALGAPLVRFAVGTAAALGGERMTAMVQLPNIRFFARLGWRPLGRPTSYVGRLHQQMQIEL
jgi:putative N-acetyltransferase (TIGR04045 family)